MKIAVLYSGLIRGESYKNNIWHMKTLLPDADFYYTTWKGRGEYDFIDKYFDEPHIPYNCERYIHKQAVKIMREKKEELGYVPEDLRHRVFLEHRWRVLGRDRVKQQWAHAVAFDEFCQGKDYDIVIRIRYDLKFKDFGKKEIDHLIDLCYNEKKPVGIGFLGDHDHGLVEVKGQNGHLIGDVIIIHRADMFDSAYVYELIQNKKMFGAEGGWWQVMCERFNTHSWTANHIYAEISERV